MDIVATITKVAKYSAVLSIVQIFAVAGANALFNALNIANLIGIQVNATGLVAIFATLFVADAIIIFAGIDILAKKWADKLK